jgi:hypothetical protein
MGETKVIFCNWRTLRLAGMYLAAKIGDCGISSGRNFFAIKPNFAFQQGGGSVIKWRMQIITACPRPAFARLHLSSNGPRSFESRAVAVSTVSKLKEIPL